MNLARLPGTSRGFTLLELLVVLMIIAVLATLLLPSLNWSRGGELEQEARRFQSLVGLAAEEAVLQGRELAVQVSDEGYLFLVLKDDAWGPVEDDELLRPRQWLPAMEARLVLEGSEVKPGKSGDSGPQVYLLSSGEMTPFTLELTMAQDGSRYVLNGLMNGRIDLRNADQEA